MPVPVPVPVTFSSLMSFSPHDSVQFSEQPPRRCFHHHYCRFVAGIEVTSECDLPDCVSFCHAYFGDASLSVFRRLVCYGTEEEGGRTRAGRRRVEWNIPWFGGVDSTGRDSNPRQDFFFFLFPFINLTDKLRIAFSRHTLGCPP